MSGTFIIWKQCFIHCDLTENEKKIEMSLLAAFLYLNEKNCSLRAKIKLLLAFL